MPAASAADCSDIEVVFARGTFAPQGLSGPGQDFVDALRTGRDLSARLTDWLAMAGAVKQSLASKQAVALEGR